jgi:hypothetical protein
MIQKLPRNVVLPANFKDAYLPNLTFKFCNTLCFQKYITAELIWPINPIMVTHSTLQPTVR